MIKNFLNRLRDRLLNIMNPSCLTAITKVELGSTTESGDIMSKFIVSGASMSRIDEMIEKAYWERKYTKEDIIALKNKMGIQLSEEYEEKLAKLDNVRPGEDMSFLVTVKPEKEADDELLLKLSLYFKDDDIARRFLKSVRDMKADTEIITLVKKHRDAKTCTDTSKKLWKILHDANIYKAKYRNWMDQLK